MRRPVLVLVPVLAILAVIASPFVHIRLANGDVNMLPPHAESRQATEMLIQQFPGHNLTTMTVVVRYAGGTPLTAERVGDLYDFSRRLASLPNVERVSSVVNVDPALGRADYQAMLSGPIAQAPAAVQDAVRQRVGTDIVVLSVGTRQGAQSDQARALVHAIRGQQPPPGSQILVGGLTAYDIDLLSFILQRIPGAVLFVVVMTYLALFLLTGSLVLPLKAVVMNVISISASFGALVWVFQQGHLSHLLNFTASSIDPSVPVLLFCIVFGLSMDYEVMLISRIQEEYGRTGDTTHAVAEGLERSGRLVTGAAAIMVAVFAAFGLADVVLIKSIGLGLALAVAIDATLVRALIVPAVMRLLGPANWWSPRLLSRLYRRINLGEPVEPTPEAA
jgi:RND superfamily putative drug exporter